MNYAGLNVIFSRIAYFTFLLVKSKRKKGIKNAGQIWSGDFEADDGSGSGMALLAGVSEGLGGTGSVIDG